MTTRLPCEGDTENARWHDRRKGVEYTRVSQSWRETPLIDLAPSGVGIFGPLVNHGPQNLVHTCSKNSLKAWLQVNGCTMIKGPLETHSSLTNCLDLWLKQVVNWRRYSSHGEGTEGLNQDVRYQPVPKETAAVVPS